jgi:serine protease SohB
VTTTTTAFVVPQQSPHWCHGQSSSRPKGTTTCTTTTTSSSLLFPPASRPWVGALAATPVAELPSGLDALFQSRLWQFFLETLIANGVPALFTIAVIGFAALQFKPRRSARNKDLLDLETSNNPVAALYNDLYGDQDQDGLNRKRTGGLAALFNARASRTPTLPQNVGVPETQYLTVTHLNRKYDSYRYTLQAATNSQAAAAARFRQTSFGRALGTSLAALTPFAAKQLIAAEQTFLQESVGLVEQIQTCQTTLTQMAVDEEMESLGMESVYELDPNVTAVTQHANTSNTNNNNNSNNTAAAARTTSIPKLSLPRRKGNKSSKTEQLQTLNKAQRELQQIEMNFVKDIVQAVGPEYAALVRTALLGDVAARGSGGLLTALQDRPLRSLFTNSADTPRVYVTRFPGDATASQVADLREEVTAIVRHAQPGDQALVVLQTGGGTVTGYGLAAAQLQRFRDAGMQLTVAVEQVAASGGYLMSCVADRIVASPFAVLGSIGVISDIPNVYDRLKKEGIEFQTVTAGKYKRTLTPTKKATKEDFDKTKKDVEDILVLFKEFVHQNRPQLDIDQVATGETWFGKDALDRKLCDEIKTVDDVIIDYMNQNFDVYEVKYEPPPEMPLDGLRLLPLGTAGMDSSSWFSSALRWMVRTVAAEVKGEFEAIKGESESVERRFMASDDRADRYKI